MVVEFPSAEIRANLVWQSQSVFDQLVLLPSDPAKKIHPTLTMAFQSNRSSPLIELTLVARTAEHWTSKLRRNRSSSSSFLSEFDFNRITMYLECRQWRQYGRLPACLPAIGSMAGSTSHSHLLSTSSKHELRIDFWLRFAAAAAGKSQWQRKMKERTWRPKETCHYCCCCLDRTFSASIFACIAEIDPEQSFQQKEAPKKRVQKEWKG